MLSLNVFLSRKRYEKSATLETSQSLMVGPYVVSWNSIQFSMAALSVALSPRLGKECAEGRLLGFPEGILLGRGDGRVVGS